MLESDKAKFHEMLDLVFVSLGRPSPDDKVVRFYFSALQRFELEEIREALNRHVVDTDVGQFVPKPADIVRNIAGNTSTQAETAWTKVDTAIRRVGPHRDVCFDDPIIHAVITDMGGWIEMCRVTEKEFPFRHAEFVKRYRGYIGRPPQQYQARLTGTNNAHNARGGFALEAPMLVGDRVQAIEVLRAGSHEKPQIVHQGGDVAENVLKRLAGGGA